MNTIDAYELRARLAPALITISPWVLVAVALLQPVSQSVLGSSAVGVVFIALLYALSLVVRHQGRRVENRLWDSWGGPPSTVLLSDADDTFSKVTKSEIRTYLTDIFGLKNVGSADVTEDAQNIQEMFRQVRQYIRTHDPGGLWFKHNAEYGFLRNLYGSCRLWFVNSAIAAAICGYLWFEGVGSVPRTLCIIGLVFMVLSILMRFFAIPGAVRTAAFRYAESSWTSFLTTAKTHQPVREGDST